MTLKNNLGVLFVRVISLGVSDDYMRGGDGSLPTLETWFFTTP